MNPTHRLAAAVALALAATAPAADKKPDNKLPDAVAKALEKAGELEVYSLDGGTQEKDGWRGAKVLGKAVVKKEADRKALAAVTRKGVEGGGGGARCFIPRHGVRVSHDGKTYDLVICFECHWVHVYAGDADKPLVLMISEGPQEVFDKLLTDAKVPLAKPPRPKE